MQGQGRRCTGSGYWPQRWGKVDLANVANHAEDLRGCETPVKDFKQKRNKGTTNLVIRIPIKRNQNSRNPKD